MHGSIVQCAHGVGPKGAGQETGGQVLNTFEE